MVKANGYGHGDVEVALRLEREGATHLGVGLIEEGLLLRQMGVRCQLLVFGIFDRRAAEEIVKWRLTPVISVWSQIEALENVRFHDMSQKIPIHIKFDTGMHRLGFPVDEAQELMDHLVSHQKLEVQGICTHLFKGDDAYDLNGSSFQQLRSFSEVERIFSPMGVVSHTLNSAGILNFHRLKESHTEPMPSAISPEQGARPGLLIYGIGPMDYVPVQLNLKSVMSLRSHIVRYHRLNAGDSVSYGATWRAKGSAVIGVIPIGYADGYHRLLSNKSEVLIKGKRVSLVGTVCMDYVMVDVTGVVTDHEIESNIEIEATMFGYDSEGNHLGVQELASKAQTIPWEILTGVGERVPRIFDSQNDLGLKATKEAKP
jgi:alanine racemase